MIPDAPQLLGRCVSMIKRVLIVGGGIAGWMSAAYLARTLGAQFPDGVRITLIESADSGGPGLGEGTPPDHPSDAAPDRCR